MSVVKKILLAAVLCCAMASLCAMEVKVIEVTGKVEVQKADKWVPVSKGDILPAGSVISTGFKSEALIAFDETVIKVKALTRLTIEQLFEKNGDKASSVYLDTGSISADVKPAENKRVGFSVKTPAATASVRGTSGDVYSDGTVIGTSGKWCITPPEARIIIPQASQNQVAKPAAAQEPASENESENQSSETTAVTETPAAEPAGTETPAAEPVVAETPAVESQPAVTEVAAPAQDVAAGQMEDFDFTYPNDLGAVFVNPGESASVSGASFMTPQDNKVQQATGSAGMQLLSETEKVAPVAPQAFAETGKPAAEAVVVPEKPKYGTVQVTVTLPSL